MSTAERDAVVGPILVNRSPKEEPSAETEPVMPADRTPEGKRLSSDHAVGPAIPVEGTAETPADKAGAADAEAGQTKTGE
jgi:hypothetical protein